MKQTIRFFLSIKSLFCIYKTIFYNTLPNYVEEEDLKQIREKELVRNDQRAAKTSVSPCRTLEGAATPGQRVSVLDMKACEEAACRTWHDIRQLVTEWIKVRFSAASRMFRISAFLKRRP